MAEGRRLRITCWAVISPDSAIFFSLPEGHDDDPLLALANVIATPHVAGVTDRSYGEIADAVVANIERLRRGEPLENRVA